MKKKVKVKVRKPVPLQIVKLKDLSIEIVCGEKGQNLVYLKPTNDGYLWIENARGLHAWLSKAIRYLEQEKEK